MKIPIRGLDHVVLRARDSAGLVGFYQRVLGCEVERVRAELGLTQLRAGNALIDIVAADGELGRRLGGPPEPAAANMDHFCLQLEHFDELALRAHFAAAGLRVGETARRYGAGGFGPSIYIEDPEGNTVELKGPAAPAP